MITKDNLKEVLSSLGFSKSGDILAKITPPVGALA